VKPDLTIGQALMQGIQFLTEHSVTPPRLTAELLLMHALGRDRTFLFTHSGDALSELAWIHYGRYLHQRSQGVPLQYITHRQEFYGRDFYVAPGVLIPRPETEHLIERVLALPRPVGVVVDAGCGSGAIAVTLALELGVRVVAVDRYATPLAITRRNADAHGARVELFEGDWLSAVRPGSVDLLVSNPPYIAETDKPTLQVEVREHEPEAALFAGSDGMDAYRVLIEQARRVLKPGGRVVFEIGSEEVRGLLDGFAEVEVLPDLAGRPCVVTASLR
jgi:release factor glutamine methyltransferase